MDKTELRIKILEMHGWKITENTPGSGWFEAIDPDGNGAFKLEAINTVLRRAPDYVEDLNDTKILIEEIQLLDPERPNRYTWEIASGSPGKIWFATITDWFSNYRMNGGKPYWEANADTIEEAVCLAYVKLMATKNA